jgi:hypothetical protein
MSGEAPQAVCTRNRVREFREHLHGNPFFGRRMNGGEGEVGPNQAESKASSTLKPVEVNTPATANALLQLGQASHIVTVSGDAPAPNMVDASIGDTFNEAQVRQIPKDATFRICVCSPVSRTPVTGPARTSSKAPAMER